MSKHQGIILIMTPALLASSLALRSDGANSERGKESFVLQIPKSIQQTRLAFENKGPPPWPCGNIAIIDDWQLVNIHAENLTVLRENHVLRSPAVRPVDDRHALVIDEKVDRRWFRSRPLNLPLDRQVEMIRLHEKYFATLQEAQTLMDSDWELVEKQNLAQKSHPEKPEHLLENILPGTKFNITESRLECWDDRRESIAERTWLINKSDHSISLTICAKIGETGNKYEAIIFDVVQLNERLILNPSWWQRIRGDQRNLRANYKNASLHYQRVTRK